MKIETKGSAVSTWDVVNKIGELGGMVLCAGHGAAWLVVAIPDGAQTEIHLFEQRKLSDIMVLAGSALVQLSMSDTPTKALRAAVQDIFGQKIAWIEDGWTGSPIEGSGP